MAKKVRPVQLKGSTHNFVKLIFDKDMFKAAMTTFDIGLFRMRPCCAHVTVARCEEDAAGPDQQGPDCQGVWPCCWCGVCVCSWLQGYLVLEQIEQILSGNHKGNLAQLSSEFYTIIPHSFGRSVGMTLRVVVHVADACRCRR